MADTGELLPRAIAAVRANRKQEAAEILREILAREPDSEWAWFWLSAAVDGIEAQRECLHRVVEINPNHAYARSGLAFLSHLRAGQEWKAEDAPWTLGVEQGVALAQAESRRCPRCGTNNPGWAYTCARCATVLQTIDVAEVVRREELTRGRAAHSLSVIEAWGGALALNGGVAFEPEVELATFGRSVSALLLGGLVLMLARLVVPTLWNAVERGSTPLALLRSVPSLLVPEAVWLAAAVTVSLLLALLLFPLAWLAGGRGRLAVHVHLVAVAVSSWMFLAAIVDAVLWLALVIAGSSEWGTDLLVVLLAMAGVLLPFYFLTLLVQAIRVAHALSSLRAMAGPFLLLVGGALLAWGLALNLRQAVLALVWVTVGILLPAAAFIPLP